MNRPRQEQRDISEPSVLFLVRRRWLKLQIHSAPAMNVAADMASVNGFLFLFSLIFLILCCSVMPLKLLKPKELRMKLSALTGTRFLKTGDFRSRATA